jgi:hypothetical protein
MPLPSGSRLGPYDVLGPLGAGGMGEVFRARDSRLGRDVAVKALPAAFAADPERLARFEREARLLASLRHPTIAGIHGREEKDGQRFLILEFVDGETLAERLKRGPLPLDDALEIAGQVAAALEAAHDAGIVHRDLKPGNIMVTPNGAARVLDFGLAKAGGVGGGSSSDQHLSASPTMTYAATAAGVILGTAAYMSPEQARGKAVDRRTDIWSLGCVLFECLAGRMAFGGETVSDTIAKILAVEPDWSALPAGTPSSVRALLRRCLEKDARKRLRDSGDVRLFLEEALAGGASGLSGMLAPAEGAPDAAARVAATAAHRRTSRLAWGVAGVALLVAAAGWLVPRGAAPPPRKPPLRAHLLSPPGERFADEPSGYALSPDGRFLAFIAIDSSFAGAIFVRPLGSLESRKLPIPRSSQIGQIFWSPDSRHLAYFADGKLRRIGIDGEGSQALADAPEPRGGSWGVRGDILFVPRSAGPIYRVPATGGVAEPATTLDAEIGETGHRFPRFLPDGKRFICISLPRRGDEIVTWIASLDGGGSRELLAAGSGAVLVDERTVVFTRGTALMAQRLDPGSGKLLGAPVRIGDAPSNLGTLGTSPVTVSGSGDLAFVERFRDVLYVDRFEVGGRRIGRLPLPEAVWYNLNLSPDGRTVALLRSDEGEYGDIWLADPERGQPTPLTRGERIGGFAAWSPDGRELAYMSHREDGLGLYIRPTFGVSEARLVFQSSSTFKDVNDWSPDGRHIIFQDLAPETRRDIWMIPVTGGDPVALVRGPADESNGQVSGDGRWLAFGSDETGRYETYVQAFPNAGPRVRVTGNGGGDIAWRGSTLFISDGADLFEVAISGDGDRPTPGDRLRIGSRIPSSFGGDLLPGGREVLVIMPPESNDVRLVLLRDWTSLLDENSAGR